MARAEVTVVQHPKFPTNPQTTFTFLQSVAADGAYYDNDGRAFIVINNPTVGAITLTIVSVADKLYGRTGDLNYVIAAGTYGVILGPFPTEGFNQTGAGDEGKTFLNVSADDLEIGVFTP